MSFQRDLTPYTKIPQPPPKPATPKFKRATEPYSQIPLNKRGGTITQVPGLGAIKLPPFIADNLMVITIGGIAVIGLVLLVLFK